MRLAFVLLLMAGCRQILGIDDPRPLAIDAPAAAPVDAIVDAPSCSDSDHDGICDAVDDWPCGAKPAAPGTVSETHNNALTTLQISAFTFVSTATPYAVVAPNAALTARFSYTWRDMACSGNCIDQIEIGYTPGDRIGCPFDQQVPKDVGAAGMTMYGLTAPAQAGMVSVRFGIGQNDTCGIHTWTLGPPPVADIAGYICVQ